MKITVVNGFYRYFHKKFTLSGLKWTPFKDRLIWVPCSGRLQTVDNIEDVEWTGIVGAQPERYAADPTYRC